MTAKSKSWTDNRGFKNGIRLTHAASTKGRGITLAERPQTAIRHSRKVHLRTNSKAHCFRKVTGDDLLVRLSTTLAK